MFCRELDDTRFEGIGSIPRGKESNVMEDKRCCSRY